MNEKTKEEIAREQKEEIEREINNKFWAVYTKNTKTLSSICRQLAFAEGGICWFYLQGSNFSIDIKLILTFLLLFLLLMLANIFF